MKLTTEQTSRLVGVVSDYCDTDLLYAHGSPQKLYDAMVADAKAQVPPYLTRAPEQLYEIAVRNRWESVRPRVVAMREP